MRKLIVAAVFLSVTVCSVLAVADEPRLGDRNHVALSVDHLFGYAHGWLTTTTSTVGLTDKQSWDDVSIFGQTSTSVYSYPVLAGDVFVLRNLSVGAAVGVFHRWSTFGTTLGGTAIGDDQKFSWTDVLIAPRVGYVLPLSPLVSLWLRAGITRIQLWQNNSATASSGSTDSHGDLTAATFDLPVAFRLVPRLALLATPFAQLGLGGSSHEGTSDIDEKGTEFGVQFGFLMLL